MVGAAAKTVSEDGHNSTLPESETLSHWSGWEVCDGAHRLDVMKKARVTWAPF